MSRATRAAWALFVGWSALGVTGCIGAPSEGTLFVAGDDDDDVLPPDAGPPECSAAPGVICTLAGDGVAAQTPDGVKATEASLYLPVDSTVGPDDLVYFLDWNNHMIRRIKADGTLETLAGNGFTGAGPDGPAIGVALNHPTNIAFDPSGVLFFAAWHNSQIKKIDLTTGQLTTVVGTGGRNFNGEGPTPAATVVLDLPSSVAFDSSGNLLIGDQANVRVRKVDTAGMVTTFAGSGDPNLGGGFSGDGALATAAQLKSDRGQSAPPELRVSVDLADNVYIADTGNNRVRIVNDAGVIQTLAGNGTAGFSGDDGPAAAAQLNLPSDVAIATDGTVYIADTNNHCIRQVIAGVISTFAGTCGERGFAGDGGFANEAQLDRPRGVSVDSQGNVFIADTHNNRLRVVFR